MSEDFSFRKSQRLLNKNDFANLRDGSRFFVSEVLVFYVKENRFGYDRLGIAVGKKYGNAVKRNAFKRRVREAFRHNENNNSLDILVSVNQKNIRKNKMSFELIEDKISKSFNFAVSKRFLL